MYVCNIQLSLAIHTYLNFPVSANWPACVFLLSSPSPLANVYAFLVEINKLNNTSGRYST